MKSKQTTPAPDRSPWGGASRPGDIDSAAADWLARRDSGLEPAEQARFQQWLAADARHVAVWRELDATWRAFDGPRQRGEDQRMIRELAHRRRRRRNIRAASTAAAGAIVLAATFLVVRPTNSPATQSTPAGTVVLLKPEKRVLADGTTVEMNGKTQIDVRFTSDRRDVRLLNGEAHFAITKDPSRPFVVTVGETAVRAVGTTFAVRLSQQAIDVLVTEGKVAVESGAAAARSPVSVEAGNLLLVRSDASPDQRLRVQPVPNAEIERRLEWRALRLELSSTPLSDVVAILNRENRLQLSVAKPSLADLRLSGVIRADNPDVFVRLLELHYGVRAERRSDIAVVLHRAK